jgi:thiol:disulfide interchange protein DsbD
MMLANLNKRFTRYPKGAAFLVLLTLGAIAFAPCESNAEVPKTLGQEVSPETWQEVPQRFKGKHALFLLWSVTCEPCIEEMPGLIEIQKELGPKGLQICSVNTDPEAQFEAAARLSEKLDLPFVRFYKKPGPDTRFRQAVDPEYGANPFALLFDPEGKKIRTFGQAHSKEEWNSILEPYLEPEDTVPAVSQLPGLGSNGKSDPLLGALDLGALGLAEPGPQSLGEPSKPTGNPFHVTQPIWTASSPTAGTLTVLLDCHQPGHLLLHALQYKKLRGSGVSLGDWKASKLEHLYMPIRDETEEVLFMPGSISIPLTWNQAESGATKDLRLRFTSQGCTDGKEGLCYPPDTYLIDGTLSAIDGKLDLSGIVTTRLEPFAPLPEPDEDEPGAEQTASPAKTPEVTGAAGSVKDSQFMRTLIEESLLWAFVVAFLFGIGTSFTPCVYPMIPATVAIFGAKEVKSRLQACALATTFVMGIALSYSVLGLTAAALGAVFGTALENPWVASVVAGVYVILGLALLDVFTFYLPSSWVTGASKVNRKGFLGAFLMGLVSSVVFAPCGGPILLGILAWVADTKSYFLGFWLTFVYAWGIGVLFFVIAVFSASIRYLPRSGVWMVAVKDFFGLLLIGLALYWLYFVLPGIWFWGLAVLYLLGVATFIHVKNQGTTGWTRAILSFGMLASVLVASIPLQKFAVLKGWLPAPALNVPTSDGTVASMGSGLVWRTGTPITDLAKAREEGKPALVDFRTNVCPKCDELEHYTFSDPEVQKALSEFVTIQVNLSEDNEEISQIRKDHDVLAVPVIEFYDSKGNRLLDKRVADFIGPEEFLEHIRGI